MQTVNIHEAKTHFSKLVEAALKGEEVVIAKAGKPAVKLVAVQSNKSRQFGLLKGKIKIADDFDEPLPEDIIADFEGK